MCLKTAAVTDPSTIHSGQVTLLISTWLLTLEWSVSGSSTQVITQMIVTEEVSEEMLKQVLKRGTKLS